VAVRTDIVPWSQAALGADSPLAALPLAILPSNGACTPAILSTVTPARPALVVCANATSGPTVTTSSNLTVLAVGSLPAAPASLGSSPLAQQALTDATILLRAKADRPVALLLDDPAAVPAATLAVTLTPADQLTPRGVAGLQPPPDPPAVSPDLITETTAIEADVALAGQLTATGPQAGALIARAVSGLWSRGWGETPEAQQAALSWAEAVAGPTRATVAGGGLELRTAESWYLTAANADVPVTIVNHYNLTVQVGVQFHSDNTQRLDIPNTPPVTVGPGQSAQVRVTPLASANGVVPVTATLVDTEGQTLTAPVLIQVRVTSAGRLGWVIIIASGLAFLVATMLRVRQVRRTRREDRERASTGEPSTAPAVGLDDGSSAAEAPPPPEEEALAAPGTGSADGVADSPTPGP